MAQVEGVAKINALAAAMLLGLASLLGVCAAALPWWTGTSKIGELAHPLYSDVTVTLWTFSMTVAIPNPEDVTTTMDVAMERSWDDLCTAADMTNPQGEPGACGMVRGIRAMTIISLLLAAAAGGTLVVAVRVSALLLMPGALVAALCGLTGGAGVMLGMAAEVNGLTGTGVGCLLASCILSFAAFAFVMYAATNAMKELEGEEHRIPRQARAEEARRKDAEVAEQLEAGVRKGRRGSTASDDTSNGGKKAPVMLKKVLFWSQEQGADGEEIPTNLLEMAFREIDKSGDGSIDTDELVSSLQLCGLNVQQATVDVIIKEIDKNCSGDIDIHEFVEFFRNLEELSRFDQKSQQQAQFMTFICNMCFVIHIIIVSVLLMNFINIDPNGGSDTYLIMKNMLIAFSAVLCLLLVFVICLPAIRLTLGQNIVLWQKAYEAELKARLNKKKMANKEKDNSGGIGGLRQAAWQQDNRVTPTTGHVPVNAALHGASYRTKKQQPLDYDSHGHNYNQHPAEMTRIPDQEFDNQDDHFGERQAHRARGTADEPIERYEPSAYRYAAMLAVENRQASSFSPMQVRDLDVPADSIQSASQPGMLALTGGGTMY